MSAVNTKPCFKTRYYKIKQINVMRKIELFWKFKRVPVLCHTGVRYVVCIRAVKLRYAQRFKNYLWFCVDNPFTIPKPLVTILELYRLDRECENWGVRPYLTKNHTRRGRGRVLPLKKNGNVSQKVAHPCFRS